VSIYSPDKSYAVFSEQYWKSDSVDNRDCGFHYNKKEPLFSQIQKLNNLVPKNSLYTGSGSENSEYNNFI
jgi:hypothetical protein